MPDLMNIFVYFKQENIARISLFKKSQVIFLILYQNLAFMLIVWK